MILENIFNLETKLVKQLDDIRNSPCKCQSSLEIVEKDITDRIAMKIDHILKDIKPNLQRAENQIVSNGRKKMLFVGDSISRSLNISVLKNVLNYDIERVELDSLTDLNGLAALDMKMNEVQLSTIVMQSGSKQLTDLQIPNDAINSMEHLKDNVRKVSENMYTLAEKYLQKFPNIDNVILLKQPYRCDSSDHETNQMKSKLCDFSSRVLDDLWLSRGCPNNIKIADEKLECQGELKRARFGHENQFNYDGIHYNGELGTQHFTGSMINALSESLYSNSLSEHQKIDLRLPSSHSEKTPRPYYAQNPQNQLAPAPAALNKKTTLEENYSPFWQRNMIMRM